MLWYNARVSFSNPEPRYSEMSDIRVRFAPSPTGKVHIGNIRAAIFNWLYARHHGGTFLLRIEDTDLERSTPEAIQTLLDCMEWLGLTYDEPAFYQTSQTKHHIEMAEDLVRRGLACRSHKLDQDGNDKGECIIFRMPKEGVIEYDDLVKGHMAKKAEDTQDFVIVRSDGSPVFHLANVLDDITQGVTHIIRGDDHVENTFKHIQLFKAFDAPLPKYAHLSMVVNAQGKPYSKRDGAAFVGEFKEQGYLPETLFNFLALLGWSPGDDLEVMSREQMIELFDLDRVKSNPAQFDLKKLLWMNGEHIRRMPREAYLERFRAETAAAGFDTSAADPAWLGLLVDQIQPRTKLYSDIAPMTGYFFKDDYAFDEKAVAKRLAKPGVKAILADIAQLFETVDPEKFKAADLEPLVRSFCESKGEEFSFSKVVHPVRVAVTGRGEGPGFFEVLELLGKDRTLARMAAAAEKYCP